MTEGTAGYARSQVVLHWLIVALVVVQFLSAEAMEDFFDAAEKAGRLAGVPDPGVALVHAAGGGLILVLTLLRFGLRIKHGAPPLPSSLPAIARVAARVTHYAFYVLLVLTPLTGALALYVTTEAGDVHKVLKTVLLVLIGLHVAGALVHAFVLRDGVIGRMLPIGR